MNLEEETVKHGISETFADPRVLDFDAYAKSEAAPGGVYPLRPFDVTEGGVNNRFYERKPATLGREVEVYNSEIDQLGQFIPGAFPSIYGGVIEGGSKTGKEYEISRAQALQRLSLIWKIIVVWWPHVMKKACDDFFANLKRDLSYTKQNGKNSFMNVWIKKESLSGAIGDVYVESSAEFPISWNQKQDRFMNLLSLGSPMVDSAISDPDNSDLVKRLVGFPEMSVPGAEDRQKQLIEIQMMLSGNPVQIDPFDDNTAHTEVTRNFLISAQGMALKNENPEIYQMIVQHWQQHSQMMQQQQMQEMQMQQPQVQGEQNA